MVYIFYSYINEANHQKMMTNYLPTFSKEFQGKILRYRKWQDAQLSLLGRILLVEGMKSLNFKVEKINIKYTDFNKPYLDKSNVRFNISHSGEIAICVLTHIGEIGIDIEKIETIQISDFKSQMTNNEWNLVIKSKDSNHSFFNYWTQKEAVVKATGNGLSISLKSFEVENNETTIGSKYFFLKKIDLHNNYSCHLALQQNIDSKIIQIKKIDF